MKNEVFTTRKGLNYKKVASVIALIVIVLLFVVGYIYYSSHKEEIETRYKESLENKTQLEIYNNAIKENQLQEERIAKKNEEARLKKKYKPLSKEEINKLKTIYDDKSEKQVFLTFDDGPNKSKTEPILDILKENGVKANFFILGQRVEYNPELIRREYLEGHFIGNHSYTHQYKTIYSSVENVWNEYNTTNQIIRDAIGNQDFNTLIFRFPGGRFGTHEAVEKEATAQFEDQGIGSIDWNALTQDAESSETKEQVMESLKKTVGDKTSVVLLMHDASDKQQTVDALPDVINWLREQGFKFKTFYEYLGR